MNNELCMMHIFFSEVSFVYWMRRGGETAVYVQFIYEMLFMDGLKSEQPFS